MSSNLIYIAEKLGTYIKLWVFFLHVALSEKQYFYFCLSTEKLDKVHKSTL